MNSKLAYKTLPILLLLISCNNQNSFLGNRKKKVLFTDMANRTILIPDSINKVVSNGSPGGIFLYTLANDLMVGRNNKATISEQKLCTHKYCQLPVIGNWFATNGTRNIEELIKIQPDVIVSAGNTNQAAINIIWLSH